MYPLDRILKLDDEQIAIIQNAYLESKTIDFRKFFVGGDYAFSPVLMAEISKELEKKDPKISVIIQLLESDPYNLLRLVSLAHSPVYIRANLVPAVTSLIQQFGYKRLPKLVEEGIGSSGKDGLAGFYSKRALGLEYFQRALLAAKLSKKIAALYKATVPVQEETYLLSVGLSLFQGILAGLNASLLSSWNFDSAMNNISLQKNCEKFFISDEIENCSDILRKMSLPMKFLQTFSHLSIPPWNKRTWTKEEQEKMQIPCSSSYIANEIIEELFAYDYESKFYTLVSDLAEKCGLEYQPLMELVTELPVEIKEAERRLGLAFIDLPGFLVRHSKKHLSVDIAGQDFAKADKARLYKTYFSEIKDTISDYRSKTETRFLIHAINLTMHVLVKVLKFERVILFNYDTFNNCLVNYFSYGRGKDLAEGCKVKVEIGKNRVSPVVQAFFEAKAVFNGDPVFEDNWPFVAFPISFKGEIYGVFYADLASKNSTSSLSIEEQMSLTNLAESWLVQ